MTPIPFDSPVAPQSMVALDIETVPLASALVAEYDQAEHAPPSNYKTDEAIAGWHARNEAKWRATMEKEAALSPMTGRVCAVAIAGESPFVMTALDEQQEARVLATMWSHLASRQCGRPIATFNGTDFDIPFLAVRSAVHGIVPTVSVPDLLRRYSVLPHFDTRMALGNHKPFARGTLDAWCAMFKIEDPDPMLEGMTGADVARLVADSDGEMLSRYCLRDAERARRLAARLWPVYGV